MQIHAERNTIIKRWRLHGQLLKFHAQGDHQTDDRLVRET